MSEQEWLVDRFEAHRRHLGAVAFRMLGSQAEAEDAVQETWLRLNRGDGGDIENLGGWLTTVVSRAWTSYSGPIPSRSGLAPPKRSGGRRL
jgi:RNA polymerase sigma-70 factor (ECF subfamily)